MIPFVEIRIYFVLCQIFNSGLWKQTARVITDCYQKLASYIYQHTKTILNTVKTGQPYKNKKGLRLFSICRMQQKLPDRYLCKMKNRTYNHLLIKASAIRLSQVGQAGTLASIKVPLRIIITDVVQQAA